MELVEGTRLKGYQLEERIGTGGFGAVYRARQSTINREVAIKIILPGYANQPDFIRRFESEALLIARLEHPHITPLHDFWRDPDGAYLVMRYLRGGSVRDALEDGPLALDAISLWLDQIASALDFAHRNAVIHRDIKPGNILLDEDGNTYLADFGIAKDLSNFANGNTAPDAVVGSLDYISPEQARSETVTPRTDIYSLGVTLYEMITGHHPFEGVSSVERLYKHINDPLPKFQTKPDVQDALNTVIQKATSKDPANRYPDVMALAVAFRDAIGRGVTYHDASIVEQLTMREHEILSMIVKGMSNRDIADELVVTMSTVKWHINQLYKKLGVRSRVQAIVRARELDLIVTGDTADIPGDLPGALTAIALPEPENPYKGLHAFQTTDARDFFGRDELTQKLIDRLCDDDPYHRFLAIVGPSGSGKSSLVKAALIPALWKGAIPGSERWFVVDVIPGARPLDKLETALIRVAANQASNLREQLQRDEWGLIRVADIILPADDTELVIVVDQFEEVFTLVEDEDARQQFLDLLRVAVGDVRSRVRVVVTLRADYYDRPLQYPEFGELIRNRMETVLPLSAKGLERAIRGPAERVAVTFEQGLVEHIVSAMNYQSGALPLLQYALTELFDRREERLLTHEAYQAIGGAVGALAHRADEIFLSLTDDAQELGHQMFMRLVTLGEGAEDTRRRATHAELLSLTDDSDLMEEIIDQFAAYRLLSLDHDPETRQPTVEVAHEAILREWDRLRQWLNESREDIRQERAVSRAAEDWNQHNRDTSYLLRGARLEQVEKWRDTTALIQTPLEQEFIALSLKQREKERQAEVERQQRVAQLERRSRNFLRGLVAIFAFATILSGGFGLFALEQQRIAQTNAEQARISAAEAQNVALVAGSQAALAKNDTDTALALAWQAVSMNPESTLAQAQLSEAAYRPGTIRRFVGHSKGVNDVAISPDEKTIISASSDYSLILWDIQTGEILKQFKGHTNPVRTVAFSPDGQFVVSGSADMTAILWDVQAGQMVHQFEGYDNVIETIAFSPDGPSIVAGGQSGLLIQWNSETGRAMRIYEGHTNVVVQVVLTPDGSAILSGSADGTLILWDADTGEIIHHMGTGSDDTLDSILSIAIRPDGTQALSGDTGGNLVLWNLQTGEMVRRFELASWVASVAFLPDGQHVLAGRGNINDLLLLDIESGNQVIQLIGDAYPQRVVPMSDNRRVISTTGDELRLWDLYQGQIIRRFDVSGSDNWEVDRSPDGRIGLVTSYDGTATVFDMETGAEIGQFHDNQPIVSGDLSPDDSLALFGTGYIYEREEPGHIILWDVETGQEIRRLVGHPGIVWDVEFSPDGRTAVSGGAAGVMILWNVETGQEIRRFATTDENPPSSTDVWDVTFSPDGQMIVTSYADGTLILWDVKAGGEVRRFLGHTDGAEGVVFSHDGQKMLSAGYDLTAILWDVRTGSIIRRFTNHTGAVFQVQFSPDDHFVLTGSADGTTLLWEVETGNVVRRYSNAGVYQPAFGPDGRTVFVSFREKSPELWRIDDTLDELLDWTQANRYIPELTCEQRELYQIAPSCESDG